VKTGRNPKNSSFFVLRKWQTGPFGTVFVILPYKSSIMEQVLTAPVSFTETAIAELTRITQDAAFDHSQRLRVGVKGGGCSGMTYVLAFDHQQENDEVFESNGLHCIMNRAHGIYLTGMQIDWENGLNNRGFTFKNPNASTTCGCGTSFGV
jgi:iron-sulfur cluster assembly protein